MNEIIKAFKACVFHETDCEQCPYFRYQDCTEMVAQDLDDIVNRTAIIINKAKAEAYKEFADKLKENSIATFSFKGVVMVEEIDDLLKELVGEDK